MNSMMSYYFIYPKGLASLGLAEIEHKLAWLSINDFQFIKLNAHGIEFECSSQTALTLQSYLKLPTRLLLRIHQSKVRDLPRLYKKILKINWKDWTAGNQIEWKVQSAQSRLIHSGKIQDSAQKAYQDYLKANPVAKKIATQFYSEQPLSVYLNLYQDQMQISLDLSGRRLDLRQEQLSHQFKAPLRRSLAAAMVFLTMRSLSNIRFHLYDPFCGSGTLLHEAETFFQITKRVFASQFIPFFEQTQIPTMSETPALPFLSYHGSDLNPIMKKFKKLDFFQMKDDGQSPKVMISNPPYQKRIRSSGLEVVNIMKKAKQLNFDYTGLILPIEDWQTFRQSLSPLVSQPISNGGINCEFRLYHLAKVC